MTLAAILYRHLGQSVPAVPNCPGSPGQLAPAPQPVPVVPAAVPEENRETILK